jgi:adenosylmethionine-8-amino-7-oxononanoate aminotransferase
VGAVSLGHIDLFHGTWKDLLFKTDRVMAPYCYRCPFNRARPDRADAREYRRCNWECVDKVEQIFATTARRSEPYAGFLFEPRLQGAAGMIAHPDGWLNRTATIARGHGSLLIADEVMTAFGRLTPPSSPGGRKARSQTKPALLASHLEGVQPDLVALAKGLTGGYLPMAATLTTAQVFEAFLGEFEEFKTFFHGHSYTGNQLGAAASLANLELLTDRKRHDAIQRVGASLGESLKELWCLPNVGDIRQEGCVAGIELVRDWRTRKPFDVRKRVGARVTEAMARRGVLTRPVGDVIVLMPPYCSTQRQVNTMVRVLGESIREVLADRAH